MISIEEIRERIDRNMEKWLFAGQHVSGNHMNVDPEELVDRLGRNEDGKIINRSSSFYDQNNGDDIINGIAEDMKKKADVIRCWLGNSSNNFLGIRIKGMPAGVTGLACSIYEKDRVDTNGYFIILSKAEQIPFYLLTAYPVRLD